MTACNCIYGIGDARCCAHHTLPLSNPRPREPIRLYELEASPTEWVGKYVRHPNLCEMLELCPILVEGRGGSYYYFAILPKEIKDLVLEHQGHD